SYYTKGALVALCFDLSLRLEGHTTLDAVMRGLWAHCRAGPMRESDFAAVLSKLGQRSFAPELAAWVHGKQDLPLKALLTAHGISVLEDPAQLAQRLGLRVTETQGLHIRAVLRGSAAEKAGFAAGDEWLGVAPVKANAHDTGWRMQRLDDLLLYAGAAKKMTALVSRDKRLLKLGLTMPPAATTWRLALQDTPKAEQWLSSLD
ncbi:MAG: peptidase M61, partial [Chitinophagaceae bacterium]|nr:peptidase M61 [Polaromonas sp.]